MLVKTHLAFNLFFALLFFDLIKDPLIFLPFFVLGTILPDIDSKSSKIGKNKLFRIFQIFLNHRGLTHNFFFILGVSCLLFILNKPISLGLFFGYTLHLILDCLTLNGVRIFYPFKFRIRGFIKTNGLFEKLFFIILIILDFILCGARLSNIL